MPRCVSFDFDNTLLLSEHTKVLTMREIVSVYDGGLDVLETVPRDSRMAPPGVKVTRYTIFEGVARGLIARGTNPPDETDAVSFGAKMSEQFSTVLQERLVQAREVPGATALLEHLAAHGIACYVNTATPQEPIDLLVDALGWRSRFRRVLGAPGTKVENLAAAAAAEGLSAPLELVHVGDGDNDCKAARDFGCPFVGIALDPALGGSGTPGGGFTAPCHTVAADLAEAARPLCALLGLPPPSPPAAAALPVPPPPSGSDASVRSFSCSRCVDCGFVLSETAASWPTCKPLGREVHKSPETSRGPGARGKQSFTLNGGTGTHIDAPAHFIPGGRSVEQLLPDELAAVPLVVVDSAAAAASAGVGTDACVGVDVIRADEAANGPIPPGALVCIRTGWAATRYADAALYLNAPDTSDIDPYVGLPRMVFPGLSAEAATFLVRERNIRGLGVDTCSPDGGDGAARGFPVHHAVLGADRYIIENLNLVGELPARGAVAFVAPLNVRGAPEAPARVWAMLP